MRIFFLLFLAKFCDSKYLKGEIHTSENWVFLGRFCFRSALSEFEYFLNFTDDQGTPNLLIYYDADDAFSSNKTCYEKESVLRADQNQIIKLAVDNDHLKELSGCAIKHKVQPKHKPTTTPRSTSYTTEEASIKKPTRKNVEIRTINCHNARKFRSTKERWFFVALSNCCGRKGIHVKYKIVMTNAPSGDFWHQHFSAEEFPILPTLIAFFIAYFFLMLGVVKFSVLLKWRELLHTTYKMFVASAIFHFLGIIVAFSDYLKYGINGVGPGKIKRVGAIFMGASETIYLLLLLLLAQGFTITRGRLPLGASIKHTIFMCFYVFIYISIFIYEGNFFDSREVLYVYESPLGYGLIILRVLAWGMFIYSTAFTIKRHPKKAKFYYSLSVCGTVWFILGPAFVLLANLGIDELNREAAVCAVLQSINFVAHLAFLILTRPSVVNKNFPYHVRTTQIGIMELIGSSKIQQQNGAQIKA